MKLEVVKCRALASCGLLAGLMCEPAIAAEKLLLPSGLEAHLQQILTHADPEGITYRYRFVAAEFAPSADRLEMILEDLLFLCDSQVIPALADADPRPVQAIISLASEEVEFGVVNPSVRQVFEIFTLQEDSCIWEMS